MPRKKSDPTKELKCQYCRRGNLFLQLYFGDPICSSCRVQQNRLLKALSWKCKNNPLDCKPSGSQKLPKCDKCVVAVLKSRGINMLARRREYRHKWNPFLEKRKKKSAQRAVKKSPSPNNPETREDPLPEVEHSSSENNSSSEVDDEVESEVDDEVESEVEFPPLASQSPTNSSKEMCLTGKPQSKELLGSEAALFNAVTESSTGSDRRNSIFYEVLAKCDLQNNSWSFQTSTKEEVSEEFLSQCISLNGEELLRLLERSADTCEKVPTGNDCNFSENCNQEETVQHFLSKTSARLVSAEAFPSGKTLDKRISKSKEKLINKVFKRTVKRASNEISNSNEERATVASASSNTDSKISRIRQKQHKIVKQSQRVKDQKNFSKTLKNAVNDKNCKDNYDMNLKEREKFSPSRSAESSPTQLAKRYIKICLPKLNLNCYTVKSGSTGNTPTPSLKEGSASDKDSVSSLSALEEEEEEESYRKETFSTSTSTEDLSGNDSCPEIISEQVDMTEVSTHVFTITNDDVETNFRNHSARDNESLKSDEEVSDCDRKENIESSSGGKSDKCTTVHNQEERVVGTTLTNISLQDCVQNSPKSDNLLSSKEQSKKSGFKIPKRSKKKTDTDKSDSTQCKEIQSRSVLSDSYMDVGSAFNNWQSVDQSANDHLQSEDFIDFSSLSSPLRIVIDTKIPSPIKESSKEERNALEECQEITGTKCSPMKTISERFSKLTMNRKKKNLVVNKKNFKVSLPASEESDWSKQTGIRQITVTNETGPGSKNMYEFPEETDHESEVSQNFSKESFSNESFGEDILDYEPDVLFNNDNDNASISSLCNLDIDLDGLQKKFGKIEAATRNEDTVFLKIDAKDSHFNTDFLPIDQENSCSPESHVADDLVVFTERQELDDFLSSDSSQSKARFERTQSFKDDEEVTSLLDVSHSEKCTESKPNESVKQSNDKQKGSVKRLEDKQNRSVKRPEDKQNHSVKRPEDKQNHSVKRSEDKQNRSVKRTEDNQKHHDKHSEDNPKIHTRSPQMKEKRVVCEAFLACGACKVQGCQYVHYDPTEKQKTLLEELEEDLRTGVLNIAVSRYTSRIQNLSKEDAMTCGIALTNAVFKFTQFQLFKDIVHGFTNRNKPEDDVDVLNYMMKLSEPHALQAKDALFCIYAYARYNNIRLTADSLLVLLKSMCGQTNINIKDVIRILEFHIVKMRHEPPTEYVTVVLKQINEHNNLAKPLAHVLSHFSTAEFAKLDVQLCESLHGILKTYNLFEQANILEKQLDELHIYLERQRVKSEANFLKKIESWVEYGKWDELVKYFINCAVIHDDIAVVQAVHCALLANKSTLISNLRMFISRVKEPEQKGIKHLFLLGQMVTAIMLQMHAEKNFYLAYELLTLLHAFNINYYHLQKAVFRGAPCEPKLVLASWALTTPNMVALAAVDICLQVNAPLSAIIVLKSFNWARPMEELTAAVSAAESSLRSELFLKLARNLLQEGSIKEGAQVFKEYLDSIEKDLKDKDDDITAATTNDAFELFNAYMSALINKNDIDGSLELYEYYKRMNVSLDLNPSIFRALIITCISNDLHDKAESLFEIARMMGVYNKQTENVSIIPHKMVMPSHLTQCEMRLVLKDYLFQLLPVLQKCEASFEERFSLHITLQEFVPDDNAGIGVLQNVSPQLQCAFERLGMTLLNESPSLEFHQISNCLVAVTPHSLYGFFMQSKNAESFSSPKKNYNPQEKHPVNPGFYTENRNVWQSGPSVNQNNMMNQNMSPQPFNFSGSGPPRAAFPMQNINGFINAPRCENNDPYPTNVIPPNQPHFQQMPPQSVPPPPPPYYSSVNNNPQLTGPDNFNFRRQSPLNSSLLSEQQRGVCPPPPNHFNHMAFNHPNPGPLNNQPPNSYPLPAETPGFQMPNPRNLNQNNNLPVFNLNRGNNNQGQPFQNISKHQFMKKHKKGMKSNESAYQNSLVNNPQHKNEQPRCTSNFAGQEPSVQKTKKVNQFKKKQGNLQRGSFKTVNSPKILLSTKKFKVSAPSQVQNTSENLRNVNVTQTDHSQSSSARTEKNSSAFPPSNLNVKKKTVISPNVSVHFPDSVNNMESTRTYNKEELCSLKRTVVCGESSAMSREPPVKDTMLSLKRRNFDEGMDNNSSRGPAFDKILNFITSQLLKSNMENIEASVRAQRLACEFWQNSVQDHPSMQTSANLDSKVRRKLLEFTDHELTQGFHG